MSLSQLESAWNLLFQQHSVLSSLSKQVANLYGNRLFAKQPLSQTNAFNRESWTYEQVEEDVEWLSRLYHFHNLAGQTVLVALPNRFSVLLHILALCRCGAIPVPINPKLKTHDFQAIVSAVRASFLISSSLVLPQWKDLSLEQSMQSIFMEEGSLAFSNEISLPLARKNEDFPSFVGNPLWQETLLLCTSGTTGTPKAAELSGKSLLKQLKALLLLPPFPFRDSPNHLVASLPLSHIMGISMALGCLCAGIQLSFFPNFQSKEIMDFVENEKPNLFLGVPTMYADMLQQGASKRDLTSIQVWLSAADKMPEERALAYQQMGSLGHWKGKAVSSALFLDIYGMVELGGAMAVRLYPPRMFSFLPVPSLSFVLPGFETRVVNEEGREVHLGQTGQLEVRGTSVLSSYYQNTSSNLRKDGWFVTGDFVRKLPWQWFQIMGRNQERLKINGFSVFPAEVEEIMRKHPLVEDALLVGVKDERMGQVPVLLYRSQSQDSPHTSLQEFAQKELTGYRRPHFFFQVEEFPLSQNGKVDRNQATQIAEKLLGGMLSN